MDGKLAQWFYIGYKSREIPSKILQILEVKDIMSKIYQKNDGMILGGKVILKTLIYPKRFLSMELTREQYMMESY